MANSESELIKQAEQAFMAEDMAKAESFARLAVTEAEQANDVPLLIGALEYLGFLLMNDNERKAEHDSLRERISELHLAHATKQIAELEAEHGPDHPDLIKPLLELADVYATRLYEGRHKRPNDSTDLDESYANALTHHDLAEAICRAAHGGDSKEYADYLMRRARFVSFHAGDWTEASALCRRALDIYERIDPASKDSRHAKFQLAFDLDGAGQLEEAARHYEEIIAAEPDDSASSPVRSLLAMTYERMGRVDEARAIQRLATEVEKEEFAETPYLRVSHLMHLAGELLNDGKFTEAEEHYREAIAASAAQPDPKMSMSGLLKRGLAECLCALDRFDEAIEQARQSVADIEAKLGNDHFHTAASLVVLADCLEQVNAADEVPALCRRAADILLRLENSQFARSEDETEFLLPRLRAQGEAALADRLQARIEELPRQWHPPLGE